MPPNMKESFVWNESEVQNAQCLQIGDSNLRGGWNRIKIAKLSLRNKVKLKQESNLSSLWGNENKNVVFTRYQLKIVGIKEPLVESERYEVKVKNQI